MVSDGTEKRQGKESGKAMKWQDGSSVLEMTERIERLLGSAKRKMEFPKSVDDMVYYSE